MKEIWRDVSGYEGRYQVSNLGRVKALPLTRAGYSYQAKMATKRNYSERILRPGKMRDYLGVRLYGNGWARGKTYLVHRLVAQAFIPNPENKGYVNHINFNPHDNLPSNLEWVTQYENIHHTIKHGRAKYPSGHDNASSSFKNNQIPDIFRMSKRGLSQREIAKRYGVDSSTISKILGGHTYKNASI